MKNTADNEIPNLGKKLKTFRKAANLTQEQLAEKTGMDTLYYASIEREERTPSLKMLYRICHSLRISPGDLLDIPDAINANDEDLKEIIHIELERLDSRQTKALLAFIENVLPLI